MPHLKRLLWLLAWGVWLLLGLGLHRELPREPGPVVCKLPLEPGETFEGFIHGKLSVVTIQNDSALPAPVLRRRHALTGEVERLVPTDGPAPRWTYQLIASHGLVIGYEKSQSVGDGTPSAGDANSENFDWNVRLDNLWTGISRQFPRLGVWSSFHARRPWALFNRFNRDRTELTVTFVDYEKGDRLRELTIPRDGSRLGWTASFLGDDISIVTPTSAGNLGLEIRSAETGAIMARRSKLLNYLTASLDGRLAGYKDDEHPCQTIVEDLISGKPLLIDAAPADFKFQHCPLHFSSDGQILFSPGTGVVIDLRNGNHLWKARPHEKPKVFVPPNSFEVEEQWRLKWRSWEVGFVTFALRSLQDGAFLYRTWRSTRYSTNVDHTLIFLQGAIHRLPPRVNWLLLAGCQFVLALPMLLIWFLQLRRRRYLAGAVP